MARLRKSSVSLHLVKEIKEKNLTPLPEQNWFLHAWFLHLFQVVPEQAKICSPESGVVILLFALFSLVRILNFYHLILTVAKTALDHFFLVFSTRSKTASPYFSSSTACVKKLSPLYSRSLLDCLGSTVLLFQQIPGWLKPPMRTRDWEHEAT